MKKKKSTNRSASIGQLNAMLKRVLEESGINPESKSLMERVRLIGGVASTKLQCWDWLESHWKSLQNAGVNPYSGLKLSSQAMHQIAVVRSKKKAKAPQAYIPGADFYASREWREARYEALKIADGRCSLCGRSKRDNGVTIHVDHIKPRSICPDLQLEITNLQLLCEDCNLGKSNFCDRDWRGN